MCLNCEGLSVLATSSSLPLFNSEQAILLARKVSITICNCRLYVTVACSALFKSQQSPSSNLEQSS